MYNQSDASLFRFRQGSIHQVSSGTPALGSNSSGRGRIKGDGGPWDRHRTKDSVVVPPPSPAQYAFIEDGSTLRVCRTVRESRHCRRFRNAGRRLHVPPRRRNQRRRWSQFHLTHLLLTLPAARPSFSYTAGRTRCGFRGVSALSAVRRGVGTRPNIGRRRPRSGRATEAVACTVVPGVVPERGRHVDQSRALVGRCLIEVLGGVEKPLAGLGGGVAIGH